MTANGNMPRDVEAEAEILGAILLLETIPGDVTATGLTGSDFYRPTYGFVYAAMSALHERTDALTVIALADELARRGQLDTVGGRVALEMLAGGASVSAIATHARIVRDRARQRRVIAAAYTLIDNPDDTRALPALTVNQKTTDNAAASIDWLEGSGMDPAAVPLDRLPAIPGFPFLHRGAGALFSGPTGGGRSSLMQAGSYDAAGHGVRVGYLGSEVTEDEFNARAASLAAQRGDTVDEDLRAVLSRVRYLDLASTISQAWRTPDRWVENVVARFDVLIGDPVSSIAGTLDLDFDKSNAEFVAFYDRLVQPLVSAGVTVVLLDNVGHSEDARNRAKGASAKRDRVDLEFACKLSAEPAGLRITATKVRSVRAPFRTKDSWLFGRDSQTVTAEAPVADHGPTTATFRPTNLMEKVSRTLEQEPGLSVKAIRKATGGRANWVDLARELLIAEGYVEQRTEGQAQRHHVVRPYREANEHTDRVHGVPTVSHPWPGHGAGNRVPVSHPLRGDTDPNTVTGHPADSHRVPRSNDALDSDELLARRADRLEAIYGHDLDDAA